MLGHCRTLASNALKKPLSKKIPIPHNCRPFSSATATQSKDAMAGESIGDLFTTLGATVENDPHREDYRRTKTKLRKMYPHTIGKPKIAQQLYNEAYHSLEKQYDKISNQNEQMIPVINMSRITNSRDPQYFTDIIDRIGDVLRNVGCVVIANVLSESFALELKMEMQQYLTQNSDNVVGFPKDKPAIYEIYYSKAQIRARQNPNTYKAIRFMNSLWHYPKGRLSSIGEPRMYIDRLRMYSPDVEPFKLGPHLDGGSLERWMDDEYRMCYDAILSGDWGKWDGYDVLHRLKAKSRIHEVPNQCSVFRTFQGWLSLSHTYPSDITTQLHPMLREATSMVMLRPFCDDIESDYDFAGVYAGRGMDVNPEYHKLLVDTMVDAPEIRPGDMIFWHPDTIHAVDATRKMDDDATVMYIPAMFDAPCNLRYLTEQAYAFQEGNAPPDFPQANISEKNFHNRATEKDLSEYGKLLLSIK